MQTEEREQITSLAMVRVLFASGEETVYMQAHIAYLGSSDSFLYSLFFGLFELSLLKSSIASLLKFVHLQRI